MKVGDKVKIISCEISDSNNEVNDIGIITEKDESIKPCGYRVKVEGRDDFGNWHVLEELQLV